MWRWKKKKKNLVLLAMNIIGAPSSIADSMAIMTGMPRSTGGRTPCVSANECVSSICASVRSEKYRKKENSVLTCGGNGVRHMGKRGCVGE